MRTVPRSTVVQGRPFAVVALFLAYGAVHSLLASRAAKEAFARWAGPRQRDGLYRFAYNAQAVVLFGPAVWAFVRLPDRTLYRVPRPWSWGMHLGQAAGLGLMVSAAHAVGFGAITGLAPLTAWLTGREPQREPEAQGPALETDGTLRVVGPFRFTRHPSNWGPLPVVLLFPHMTTNRLTLAALTVAYLVLGSMHEELRLEAAHGAAYDRYRRATPFLLGRREPAVEATRSSSVP